MAVGDVTMPLMHVVQGVKLAQLGRIRYPNRRDLVIFWVAEGSNVAGVYPKRFAAAPVQLGKKHLAENTPRYLIINTGNANAGNRLVGYKNAETTCANWLS